MKRLAHLTALAITLPLYLATLVLQVVCLAAGWYDERRVPTGMD